MTELQRARFQELNDAHGISTWDPPHASRDYSVLVVLDDGERVEIDVFGYLFWENA